MTNALGRNPLELTLYFINMRLVMAACWLAGVADYALAYVGVDPSHRTAGAPMFSFRLGEDHYWIGGAAILAMIAPAILL
ncbi:MAG: hypothetical protein KTR21_03210 [Rhodobacteraceae bacterium]|nr:hypothetical protein [Paracoccaceae bacterium]